MGNLRVAGACVVTFISYTVVLKLYKVTQFWNLGEFVSELKFIERGHLLRA